MLHKIDIIGLVLKNNSHYIFGLIFVLSNVELGKWMRLINRNDGNINIDIGKQKSLFFL
jgi:hypothetical protein